MVQQIPGHGFLLQTYAYMDFIYLFAVLISVDQYSLIFSEQHNSSLKHVIGYVGPCCESVVVIPGHRLWRDFIHILFSFVGQLMPLL